MERSQSNRGRITNNLSGMGNLLEFQKVPPPKNKYMHKDLQIITGFCETADGC